MEKNKLITFAVIAISLLFFALPAVHAQQLTILFTGNTQGTMLPLLK